MHSKYEFAARWRRLKRRLLQAAGLAGFFGLFAAPQALHAQTFVAEWAEADIGRVGPTGLALDTVGTST